MKRWTTEGGEQVQIGRPVICVPHQRQAYLDDRNESPPKDERDTIVAGDHDLHNVHLIETAADAQRLSEMLDPLTKDRLRHQAAAVAVLAEKVAEREGWLVEEADDEGDA